MLKYLIFCFCLNFCLLLSGCQYNSDYNSFSYSEAKKLIEQNELLISTPRSSNLDLSIKDINLKYSNILNTLLKTIKINNKLEDSDLNSLSFFWDNIYYDKNNQIDRLTILKDNKIHIEAIVSLKDNSFYYIDLLNNKSVYVIPQQKDDDYYFELEMSFDLNNDFSCLSTYKYIDNNDITYGLVLNFIQEKYSLFVIDKNIKYSKNTYSPNSTYNKIFNYKVENNSTKKLLLKAEKNNLGLYKYTVNSGKNKKYDDFDNDLKIFLDEKVDSANFIFSSLSEYNNEFTNINYFIKEKCKTEIKNFSKDNLNICTFNKKIKYELEKSLINKIEKLKSIDPNFLNESEYNLLKEKLFFYTRQLQEIKSEIVFDTLKYFASLAMYIFI